MENRKLRFACVRARRGSALALQPSVIGRKENTMRIEQAQAKKGSKVGLVGALLVLALFAGALVSMGGAPTKRAASSIEVARPEATTFVSATPESISPREEIADRDSLDLQLD
jgi:hypothetical protein